MEQPQIWHYGLVTRDWAEHQTDGGPEAAYFRRLIEQFGQPALDLGCGSGRILLPMLQAGLDVDGCDYSQDMLDQTRQQAEREGLNPRLYQSANHALDLPQRYKTIFACGVIGLGGDKRLTQQSLQRAYDHLRPGGCFAFDYHPRYNDPPAWMGRLPDVRHTLPDEWPESSEREPLSDGTELEMAHRTVAMDPLEDIATRQIRARLWRNGELIKEEIHTQMVEDFSKNELVMMLERAGFADITITGDYTDEPATGDHGALVFLARK